MRKLLRILVWVTSGIILTSATAAFILYRAYRHEPDFYVEALRAQPEKQEAAGDQLEKNVLELHNSVRRVGHWDAVFTEEQINGWLAIDLPNKFSDAVPRSIEQPRVAISPDQVLAAFRYTEEKVSTIVSLGFDLHLTEDPNVVAIRIRRARAGRIPLPLNRFIDQLSNAARHSEVELWWSQEEGDPVALVRIPSKHENYGDGALHLEKIELGDGQLRISGRSGREVAAAFFNGSTLQDHIPPADVQPAKLADQKSSSLRVRISSPRRR